MDNSDKNKRLVKILKEEKLDVYIEFTPVDNPEYNGVVERTFDTLYGCVRAMLHD